MELEENKILITFNLVPKVEIKGSIKKEYFVEFIDSDTNTTIHIDTISNNMWTQSNRRWLTNWVIKINGNIEHVFNQIANFDGRVVMPLSDARNIGNEKGDFIPVKMFMAFDPDGYFLEIFQRL